MWARKEQVEATEPDFENFTLLAKDVDFKGVVNFDGTVRVDGRVEGEIHTTGTLIVGEHAIIKGVVSAAVLMNSGKINGTITAVEKIQKNKIILKPTCLYGYKLKKRNVTLLEIEGITRYKTRFDNPLFEKLRYIKNNISAIRHNFGPLDHHPTVLNPNGG